MTAAEAIGLFTPEGERGWVSDWNPTYLGEAPTEAPGTVFVTSHGDSDTIWIIQRIDRSAHVSAYSRVTVGQHAGTVHVSCVDEEEGGCVVRVTYDMSLLPGGDSTALDAYDDASFQAMLKHWSEAISQNF